MTIKFYDMEESYGPTLEVDGVIITVDLKTHGNIIDSIRTRNAIAKAWPHVIAAFQVDGARYFQCGTENCTGTLLRVDGETARSLSYPIAKCAVCGQRFSEVPGDGA